MSVQNTDNCSEVLPCTCVQTIAMAMMALAGVRLVAVPLAPEKS
jgi:hypothetical protein